MKPTTVVKMLTLAMQFDSRIKEPSKELVLAWSELLSEIPDEDMIVIVKRIYSTHQLSVLQPGTVLDAWKALREARKSQMDKNTFQPVLGSYSSIQEELEDRRNQYANWQKQQLNNLRQQEMKQIGR